MTFNLRQSFRTIMMLGMVGALAGGCGSSGSSSSDGGSNNNQAWSYPEHQFVMDQLLLPQSQSDYAYDFNHTGTPNNQAGKLLAAVSGFLPQGQDPQTALNNAMKTGQVIALFSAYAETMQSSNPTNIWAFVGAQQSLTNGPQPGGVFSVDPAGPTNAYFAGTIASSKGTYGSDTASLTISIPMLGGDNMSLTLQAVHVTFDSSTDGNTLSNGVLVGAITQDEINSKVLPAVVVLLDKQVASDCTNHGQAVADCGCGVGSAGKIIAQLLGLGVADSCTVTLADVQSNTILQQVLQPDVQLASCTAKCAISFGVGFHAVNASFAHINPPVD